MAQRQQLQWFYVRYHFTSGDDRSAHVAMILDHDQECVEKYLSSVSFLKIEHVEPFRPPRKPRTGNRLVRRDA